MLTPKSFTKTMNKHKKKVLTMLTVLTVLTALIVY